jgi:folate-binding protein YgfZ
MLPLTLIGPRAEAVLGPEVAVPEGDWKHARVRIDGTEVTLQRTGRMGGAAFTLWVSASIASHLSEGLLAREGVRRVEEEALELLRAEAGIPRFGLDFGPDNFPQETGADEAVSYTKGCYLGQEVVARIHYRGGVQKVLRRLVFENPESPEGPAGALPRPGAQLLFEGREAGAATTVVRSPALEGQAIGLGIVHKRAAEPGARLEVEGGGTAVVRDEPRG